MIKFEPVPPDDDSKKPGASGLIWFAGIAVASGIVVAIVAYALRGLLFL